VAAGVVVEIIMVVAVARVDSAQAQRYL